MIIQVKMYLNVDNFLFLLYLLAGSIFSSPKLVGSSNPFAVRSSPGRLNDNSEPNSQSISSIIAPSKFGASSYPPQASPAAFSSSLIAANHSAKETHGTCWNSFYFWVLNRFSTTGTSRWDFFKLSKTQRETSFCKNLVRTPFLELGMTLI